ncbi:uncharacterized protein LOC124440971 isoform X2 [Xenia sp. Carnegie-2017]|uniref:uncharacterized protein LOC124440971 isoform X2 n=1 Tax=Xenia sp. Carnegie-2017 TaxID=2897299 RepID=UPI001F0375C3|nr:uncharacterized protein LOC124440971 isoform X2 [Xenia sp. Carnegie-2017]XP_046847352.1 uncharacterized protein LOC124440971 isoform X2 [Xenia sp. Carnegie-2017]
MTRLMIVSTLRMKSHLPCKTGFSIKSQRLMILLSEMQVLMRSEGQSVFWLFIKEHLNSNEIKTYNSLHNVMTDVGRAQAWLRSSLNEQSLEKYLHSFIGHKQLLFQYYEQDALLLDDERSSMLPMMAAGLSSILFAIDIDKAEFNSITVQIPGNISQAVSRPTSIWAVPSPMYATSGAPGKEKKKRKKKKANIAQIENVEFKETEEGTSTVSSHGSSSTTTTAHDSATSFTRAAYDILQRNTDSQVHARGNHSFTKRPDDFLEMPKNSQLAYCSNSENSTFSSTMAKTNVENKENETDEQVARLTKKSQEVLHLKNEFKTANDLKKNHSLTTSLQSGHYTDSSLLSEEEVFEPLVDMNSGVSLIPVVCPDDDKGVRSLAMSDENERFTVSPETSLHLVHSINDSPVSSIYTDEDVENDASLAIGATVAAICATRDGSIEINDYSGSSLVRTMAIRGISIRQRNDFRGIKTGDCIDDVKKR